MARSIYGARAGERKAPTYTPGARAFQVSEDIMPIADLKANLSGTVRSLEDRGRPLVITLNGKPAAVVMSPREYDRLTYRERFVSEVEAGIAEADAGLTVSNAEVRQRMERRFGAPKRKKR
jgi:prevent-host-death family protein